MTLKHVHTAFIVAAVALASVCAEQALTAFQATQSAASAVAGAASVVAALMLVRYEMRFLERCRREGIR